MQIDWLKIQSEKNPSGNFIADESESFSLREIDSIVSSVASQLSAITHHSYYIPIEVTHTKYFVIIFLALWRVEKTPVLLRESITENERRILLDSIDTDVWLSSKLQKQLYQKNNTPHSSVNDNTPATNNDEAVVIYTSGSTGTNKGVVLTFDNFFASYNSICKFDNYSKNDVFLASLPFHHIGGLAILMRALLSGASLHIPDSLNHNHLCEVVERIKPNYISFVPTQLKRLIDNRFKPYPELKSIYIGGGPSDTKTIRLATEQKFPIVKVYGSTETCAMVSAEKIFSTSQDFESSGKPLAGVKIGIKDFDEKLGYGEITIQSPSIFKEYLNDADSTKNAKQGDIFSTGDIGFIDDNNHLHILGRQDDVIISGGEKIIPLEIQNHILKLEDVSEVCVFGIDDAEWGQKLVALVVTSSDNFSPESFLNNFKNHLPGYKIPKNILRVDKIPTTTLGKHDIAEAKILFNKMSR